MSAKHEERSRTARKTAKAPPGSPSRTAAGTLPAARGFRVGTGAGVVLLLLFHAAMVIPGIFRNSITFDENFHLPAGLLYLERGYTHVSLGQPPLARAVYALPALLQRPALPPDSILGINEERAAGETFLRLNASRFQPLYLSSRFVALALSCLTGWLIFVFARGIYGPSAGLLALAAWVASPEVVAQAGLIGMDLPTALVFLLLVMALRNLVTRGAPRDVALLALATGAAMLVRYSALQMAPVLLALGVWGVLAGRAARPSRVAIGLAIAAVAWVPIVDLGYVFQVTMTPMGHRLLQSDTLQGVAHAVPWLRLPLPDAYIAGYDYLAYLRHAFKPIFVNGEARTDSIWWYFPLAAAVKWPLGWLLLLAARLVQSVARRRLPSWDDGCVLLPALAILAVCMASDLAYGLRYLLPAMPFFCIWAGGLVAKPVSEAARGTPRPARRSRGAGAWAAAAVILVTAQSIECAAATPWQLSHFNVLAGGHGDRIVNDSSVDWGQGLIALRDEMKKRGIRRIHLTYHGTTDPALYGIDSVPYLGGQLDSTADWLAVSTYYFVGLGQRMVTPHGDTESLRIDFRPFWNRTPVATPAHCMYLYRLR